MSYLDQDQDGSPIVAGYLWQQSIVATPADPNDAVPFPEGSEFTAQVRKLLTDTNPLVTITTAGGGITRVSDTEIMLTIPGEATVTWPSGRVLLDLVRTDTTPHTYLGIYLEIPVKVPVTRGV